MSRRGGKRTTASYRTLEGFGAHVAARTKRLLAAAPRRQPQPITQALTSL
jgi:hypothetical protein